jgi:xanthine/uracil permease
MEIGIYIGIYLVGYIVSYLLWKLYLSEIGEKWTKLNRLFSLLLSIFSWVCAVSIVIWLFIIYIVYNWKEGDEEAKW